ncbi:MAG: hypothetical protein L0Z50_10170 [Verrucomicrobiales bacterium]|nr:hypothetical protein [Verrucomicrobiales bacterium]
MGWIAIGNIAINPFFALGGIAIGPLAFGGVTLGPASCSCLGISFITAAQWFCYLKYFLILVMVLGRTFYKGAAFAPRPPLISFSPSFNPHLLHSSANYRRQGVMRRQQFASEVGANGSEA